MRTGMGALPGSKTWQEYKSGFGPWIDGMFSQSNFGVVTKMGFWLMPEPDAYLSGTVTVSRHDDLIPLVNTFNYLENTRVTNGMPDLGSPLLGIPMLSEFAARFDQGSSALSTGRRIAELTALVAKAGGEYVAGAGRLRAEEGHRLLELQAQLLRRAKGKCRELGVCEGEIFRDPGREIRGRRMRTSSR